MRLGATLNGGTAVRPGPRFFSAAAVGTYVRSIRRVRSRSGAATACTTWRSATRARFPIRRGAVHMAEPVRARTSASRAIACLSSGWKHRHEVRGSGPTRSDRRRSHRRFLIARQSCSQPSRRGARRASRRGVAAGVLRVRDDGPSHGIPALPSVRDGEGPTSRDKRANVAVLLTGVPAECSGRPRRCRRRAPRGDDDRGRGGSGGAWRFNHYF